MERIQEYGDLRRSHEDLDAENAERLRMDASKAWDVISKRGLKWRS